MRNYYYLLFILLSIDSYAQQTPEFQMQLYFEDAAGNRDTITIGYDINATDGIDSDFGEVNLQNIGIDPEGLDVSISNNWLSISGRVHPDSIVYRTKKQIVPYNCTYSVPSEIDIHTQHWPVTVSYSNVVIDSCAKYTLMTSYFLGGWFDTYAPSSLGYAQFYYNESGSFSFTSNVTTMGGHLYDATAYINNQGDTISVFWLQFTSIDFTTISVEKLEQESKLNSYPNPFSTEFTLPVQLNGAQQLKIIDINGRTIAFEQNGTTIKPLNCTPGIYFLSFELEGKVYTQKLLKQ